MGYIGNYAPNATVSRYFGTNFPEPTLCYGLAYKPTVTEVVTSITALVAGYYSCTAAIYEHDDAAATVNVQRVTDVLTIPAANTSSSTIVERVVTFPQIILSPSKYYSIAVDGDNSYIASDGYTDRYEDTGTVGLPLTWTDTTWESVYEDSPAIWAETTPNGPSLTLPTDLQPGASFTLNYSNYDAVPVSPVTITDSNNNSITVPVTISDSVNGTTGKHEGIATGTMPALPSSGSIAGLKFGTVNVNLSS